MKTKEPPYTERYVRWCERDKLNKFYLIFSTRFLKERKGGVEKITGYMGDFVEGCACFASFFAKQALDYGGKKRM